jgi:hypothetical protein
MDDSCIINPSCIPTSLLYQPSEIKLVGIAIFRYGFAFAKHTNRHVVLQKGQLHLCLRAPCYILHLLQWTHKASKRSSSESAMLRKRTTCSTTKGHDQWGNYPQRLFGRVCTYCIRLLLLQLPPYSECRKPNGHGVRTSNVRLFECPEFCRAHLSHGSWAGRARILPELSGSSSCRLELGFIFEEFD